MAAKSDEYNNLISYETFEEVEDSGQKYIDSKWVIKEKEVQDGSKHKVKARIVAKGFQEETKPKSDAPTAMRESFKLVMNIVVQEEFEILASIDIKAAFLNGKIERDVHIRPPKDLLKPGKLWKLNKLLYGMNDASRGFWKLVKNIFKDLGLIPVAGDEAFYQKRENGKLVASVITMLMTFRLGQQKNLWMN